jgi:ABC-2 type transport system ATP-binding protein
MMEYVLETHNLSKHFGPVTAVSQVNLQVKGGEVFGFLGPNRAGKTTTIGMMLGLILPSEGTIKIFNELVTPRQNEPLRQVGALVGAPALLPYLSGRENLRLLARLYSDVDAGRIEEVLALVKMTAVAEAVLHPRVAARVVQELYGAREEIFNPFLPS